MKFTLPNTTVEHPPNSCGANTERNSFPIVPSGQGSPFGSTLTGDVQLEASISFLHSYEKTSRPRRCKISSRSNLRANRLVRFDKQPFALDAANDCSSDSSRCRSTCNPIRFNRISVHGVLGPLFPSILCPRHSLSETAFGKFKQNLRKTHNERQSRFYAVGHTTLSRQKKQNPRDVVSGRFSCSANRPNITQTLNPPGSGTHYFF